ncbi:DUF190 domain-containing protein [Alicyclobacillus tolerans]|nr:DUF190 domain-containing protein [Alicyclobacillus montanus]
MNHRLLRIVVGELEGRKARVLYQEIFTWLQKWELDYIVVLRANEGLGDKDDIRSQVIEDISFNDLPIIVEAIGTRESIEPILSEIKKNIPYGEVGIMEAYRIHEGESVLPNYDYWMIKVYVKEESHGIKPANYEKILELFRENHLSWSTVTKGIEGFGEDRKIVKNSFFSWQSHIPVVVEAIGPVHTIQKIIPSLKEIDSHEMVVAIPIQLVLNR